MLETCDAFFQDSLINKVLKKHSVYLKYNIMLKSLRSVFIYFFKKLVFIQQRFAKLIETVIVKIDIVRKHLYFE